VAVAARVGAVVLISRAESRRWVVFMDGVRLRVGQLMDFFSLPLNSQGEGQKLRYLPLNSFHKNVNASALMCAAWALLAEPPWPPSMFS